MSNKEKIGLIILSIVLILILSVFNNKWTKNRINEKGKIGIFYVDQIVNGKGIPSIKYHYFDNGIWINDSYTCESSANIKKGSRYFGKYLPNQSESIICCYCEVPKEITEQPINGWESLPKNFCSYNESSCFIE